MIHHVPPWAPQDEPERWDPGRLLADLVSDRFVSWDQFCIAQGLICPICKMSSWTGWPLKVTTAPVSLILGVLGYSHKWTGPRRSYSRQETCGRATWEQWVPPLCISGVRRVRNTRKKEVHSPSHLILMFAYPSVLRGSTNTALAEV